jgi:hypothetical protein
MPRILTLTEAAAELRISKRWLADWLNHHPVDAAGVPFYVRLGRKKTFEDSDVTRIFAFMREQERVRLGPTGPVARAIGLAKERHRLSQLLDGHEESTIAISGVPRLKLPSPNND